MDRWLGVRRGISPIIATVILIAVTLAIGIAVAAWLMGIWGGLGGGEQLRIYPESELKVDSNTGTTVLTLKVKNVGSSDIVVRSITVGGQQCTLLQQKLTIKVGAEDTIKCTVNAQLTPGANYDVKVYTEGGSVFSVTLTARQG